MLWNDGGISESWFPCTVHLINSISSLTIARLFGVPLVFRTWLCLLLRGFRKWLHTQQDSLTTWPLFSVIHWTQQQRHDCRLKISVYFISDRTMSRCAFLTSAFNLIVLLGFNSCMIPIKRVIWCSSMQFTKVNNRERCRLAARWYTKGSSDQRCVVRANAHVVLQSHGCTGWRSRGLSCAALASWLASPIPSLLFFAVCQCDGCLDFWYGSSWLDCGYCQPWEWHSV